MTLNKAPSQEVLDFHNNSDADSAKLAQHHTLGTGPNQSAAGDHKHSDAAAVAHSHLDYAATVHAHPHGHTTLDVVNAVTWAPNLRNADGTALAHTVQGYRFKVVGGVCHFMLNATLTATGTGLRFDLPVTPSQNFSMYIGSGRETALAFKHLLLFKDSLSTAQIFTHDNVNSAVTGWVLVCSGSYLVSLG